jgi:hypothetical protein
MFLPVVCSSPVEAQIVDDYDEAVLWQARSCVGEVGWNDLQSCTAMAYVHMHRARRLGLPLVHMIRAYSSPVNPDVRQRSRRWVSHLNYDASEPRHWPEEASWSNFRDKWLRIIRHVSRVLEGAVRNPCPRALHYGSATLASDAPTPNMRRITCLPRSGQAFYTVTFGGNRL